MKSEMEEKVVSAADTHSQLSAVKRALLEKRLAGRAHNGADGQAISRRQRVEPPPISLSQQRLWFLSQLEPDIVAYNISEAVRVAGGRDVPGVSWGSNE